MRYFLLFCFAISLYGNEKLVLISNKNFPLNNLVEGQIKQIYLKRMHFIKDMPIIPINYVARDPLRNYFEKSILNLSPKKLKKYWMKKHYEGKRPPLVQSSIQSAIIFVKKVDGAVAYIPYSKIPKDIKILYVSKERP